MSFVARTARHSLQNNSEDVREDSVGDVCDLIEAGEQIIRGFKFKTEEQRMFAAMVLSSDRPVLALLCASYILTE